MFIRKEGYTASIFQQAGIDSAGRTIVIRQFDGNDKLVAHGSDYMHATQHYIDASIQYLIKVKEKHLSRKQPIDNIESNLNHLRDLKLQLPEWFSRDDIRFSEQQFKKVVALIVSYIMIHDKDNAKQKLNCINYIEKEFLDRFSDEVVVHELRLDKSFVLLQIPEHTKQGETHQVKVAIAVEESPGLYHIPFSGARLLIDKSDNCLIKEAKSRMFQYAKAQRSSALIKDIKCVQVISSHFKKKSHKHQMSELRKSQKLINNRVFMTPNSERIRCHIDTIGLFDNMFDLIALNNASHRTLAQIYRAKPKCQKLRILVDYIHQIEQDSSIKQMRGRLGRFRVNQQKILDALRIKRNTLEKKIRSPKNGNDAEMTALEVSQKKCDKQIAVLEGKLKRVHLGLYKKRYEKYQACDETLRQLVSDVIHEENLSKMNAPDQLAIEKIILYVDCLKLFYKRSEAPHQLKKKVVMPWFREVTNWSWKYLDENSSFLDHLSARMRDCIHFPYYIVGSIVSLAFGFKTLEKRISEYHQEHCLDSEFKTRFLLLEYRNGCFLEWVAPDDYRSPYKEETRLMAMTLFSQRFRRPPLWQNRFDNEKMKEYLEICHKYAPHHWSKDPLTSVHRTFEKSVYQEAKKLCGEGLLSHIHYDNVLHNAFAELAQHERTMQDKVIVGPMPKQQPIVLLLDEYTQLIDKVVSKDPRDVYIQIEKVERVQSITVRVKRMIVHLKKTFSRAFQFKKSARSK